MKKLRVLACAFTCCAPGTEDFRGGEDYLGWNLLQQLARFHEVWAITNARDRRSIERSLAEEQTTNLHFCYVGLPGWLLPLTRYQGGIQTYYHLWQIKAYFAARKLHREHRFELFHHITYANDWLANFIGAFLPVPYIRGPGGGAHRTPDGFEREYRLGGRIWEKIRAFGQRSLRLDPIFMKGQSRAKAILLCNRESISMVPKKWAHKVHQFPVSGISSQDLEHWSPPGTGACANGRRFRVITAGSLIRVKGFSLAIKSFGEFAAKHPECQFDIVGKGPEEPRLRDLVRRSHLEDRVNFLGAMPRSDLLREMASSDVFLFPSLRDGGGTVAVEAMAVGKPVVCLDVGGPGMHVTEQSGIKIVPERPDLTAHKLASALETLYLDKDLRHRLGQGARQRATQIYHWDRLGEHLMGIYQHALGGVMSQ